MHVEVFLEVPNEPYLYDSINNTPLHYGSFPFTSVVGSESRPSRGIFVT